MSIFVLLLFSLSNEAVLHCVDIGGGRGDGVCTVHVPAASMHPMCHELAAGGFIAE